MKTTLSILATFSLLFGCESEPAPESYQAEIGPTQKAAALNMLRADSARYAQAFVFMYNGWEMQQANIEVFSVDIDIQLQDELIAAGNNPAVFAEQVVKQYGNVDTRFENQWQKDYFSQLVSAVILSKVENNYVQPANKVSLLKTWVPVAAKAPIADVGLLWRSYESIAANLTEAERQLVKTAVVETGKRYMAAPTFKPIPATEPANRQRKGLEDIEEPVLLAMQQPFRNWHNGWVKGTEQAVQAAEVTRK